MKALVAVTCMFVLVVGGWFAFRQWYVDTHCTSVLGTQVCGTQEQSPVAPQVDTPAPAAPQPSLAQTAYILSTSQSNADQADPACAPYMTGNGDVNSAAPLACIPAGAVLGS